MNPDTFAAVAAIAAALSALASFLALLQTNRTLRLMQRGNQGPAMAECIDEHRTILDALATGNLAGKTYFERLWALHFKQYNLYRLGLIPKTVYVTWLQVRHRIYTSGATVATVSERDGWTHASPEMDANFVAFIEDLMRLPTAASPGIEHLLDKHARGA